MSKRAEKRALELFHVDIQMCIDSTGEPYEVDVNAQRRKYVAFGYEQAEKETIERACDMLMNYVFEEVTPEMRDHFRKRLEEK